MAIHLLKRWPEYFVAVMRGAKKFEVRRFDRRFAEGDTLILREWSPEKQEYTGRKVAVRILYLLHGGQFGIEPGYCVMSIEIYAERKVQA